jgi:hypothetical protein
VQIEEQTAVGRFCHVTHELAVPQFVASWPEIVHTRLDADGNGQGLLEVAN